MAWHDRILTTSTSPYQGHYAEEYVEFVRPERRIRGPEFPGGVFVHPTEQVRALVITVDEEAVSDVLDYHYGPRGWRNLIPCGNVAPDDAACDTDAEPPCW